MAMRAICVYGNPTLASAQDELTLRLLCPVSPCLPRPCLLPCSEEDADRAHRRIQRLRAFHFGAAQFVGALQAFMQSRTAGGWICGCWVEWGGVGEWCTLSCTALLPTAHLLGAPACSQPLPALLLYCSCTAVLTLYCPALPRRGLRGAPAGQADGQLRRGGGSSHQQAAQR